MNDFGERFVLFSGRFDFREPAVPGGINGANAFGQRRVRGHGFENGFAQAVAEKHVAHVGSVLGFQFGTVFVGADFLERAGQAAGVAGELHGRGVGEKFALATHGGLNQAAKENAGGTEDDEGETKEREGIAIATVAAAHAHEDAADGGEAKQTEDDADEAQIQLHVAIQNMAEFMADDALEFIAGKAFDAAARHADGGIASGVTGGEGIDTVLLVQHINERHGHAGGNGHFLDDVKQLAFVGIGGVLADLRAAHQTGHGAAAGGEFTGLVGAAEKYHGEHAEGGGEENFGVPQVQLLSLTAIVIVAMM